MLARLFILLAAGTLAMESAAASTYCNPRGPSAPGYCSNIPHKGKVSPSKPHPKPRLPSK